MLVTIVESRKDWEKKQKREARWQPRMSAFIVANYKYSPDHSVDVDVKHIVLPVDDSAFVVHSSGLSQDGQLCSWISPS